MKVTIVIPSYNMEHTIRQAVQSAVSQDYPDKEVLVVDDCSTDRTIDAITDYVKVIVNELNLGIGDNLTKCMNKSQGEYIIFLCGDDFFANTKVVSDMVEIFEADERVGVIGRSYYQFLNGYPRAVTRVDENILISSCNPSGMGFRKRAMTGKFSNKIFLECPTMVKRILSSGWGYQIMDYDTVAVRLHDNNTAIKSSYYTESPTENWNTLIPGYVFYPGFISLKMRCPSILLKEILITIKVRPICLFSPKFWACIVLSCLPGYLLHNLSRFYLHKIKRRFCVIKLRSR